MINKIYNCISIHSGGGVVYLSMMHSEIDRITSKDIKKITQKFFRTPFLSISGNKRICLEINKRWCKNF